MNQKPPLTTRLRNYLLKLQPLTHYQSDPRRWEREYARGKWDHLGATDQLPHYSVIAGYVRHYASDSTILDIGCGEGLLQEHLATVGYSHYLGIDFSETAMRQALPREDARTRFLQADAETYHPDRSFDAIICNESLYYFRRPLASLGAYDPHLSDQGVYIISMWDSIGTRRLWRKLGKRYHTLDAVKLTGPSGVSHKVKVLRPASSP